jgi:hypothetical protein
MPETKLAHGALRLSDGVVAFERVNAGEPDELLRVAPHDLGDGFVAQAQRDAMDADF